MLFGIMDQRGVSSSPQIFEDARLLAETRYLLYSPLEPLSNLARDQEGKLGMGEISRGVISCLSESSWNLMDHHPKSWSDLYMLTAANNINGNRTNTNLIQHESSLFSSSLSEIFGRKRKISFLCILSLYVLDVFALLLSNFLQEDTLLDLMLDGFIDNPFNLPV